MKAKIFKMSEAGIDYKALSECVSILDKGGIVGFPTETVYGLGVNSNNPKGLNRLYELKKRTKNKPFTIHISPLQRIDDFTTDNSTRVYKLIDKFWPGPLTLILAGKKKNEPVGLRCPSSRIAQELINRSIHTLVATSANFSGSQPAIDSQDVLGNFADNIEAIIDAGRTSLALESSIVDLSKDAISYPRIAAIDKEKIEKTLKTKIVLFVCTGNSCRSVMAKALLEKKLKESGKPGIEVIDAGTGTFGGMLPTAQTIELLAHEGIDVSAHTSVQLTRRIIRRSDLILVMSNMHKEQILSIEPQAISRVFLLKEFAFGKGSKDLEIPDPIGQPMEIYEDCFKSIKQSIERVSDIL